MADGTSGGVVTGLEDEIEILRQKKQAEEDRRMGRMRKRQKQLHGTIVSGMPPEGGLTGTGVLPVSSVTNAGGSTLHLFNAGGDLDGDTVATAGAAATGITSDPTVPVGNDGTVRVGISMEMQERLDRMIHAQVGAYLNWQTVSYSCVHLFKFV